MPGWLQQPRDLRPVVVLHPDRLAAPPPACRGRGGQRFHALHRRDPRATSTSSGPCRHASHPSAAPGSVLMQHGYRRRALARALVLFAGSTSAAAGPGDVLLHRRPARRGGAAEGAPIAPLHAKTATSSLRPDAAARRIVLGAVQPQVRLRLDGGGHGGRLPRRRPGHVATPGAIRCRQNPASARRPQDEPAPAPDRSPKTKPGLPAQRLARARTPPYPTPGS